MRDGELGQRDVRLPLLLLSLAMLVWLVTGTVSLVMDRNALAGAQENQARAAAEGDRVRRQVDALLLGATGLASGGNTAAKSALEVMARQGVTYTAPARTP